MARKPEATPAEPKQAQAKQPEPLTTIGIAKTPKGYVAVSVTTQGDKVIARTVHSKPSPLPFAAEAAKMAFVKLILMPGLTVFNLEDDLSAF